MDDIRLAGIPTGVAVYTMFPFDTGTDQGTMKLQPGTAVVITPTEDGAGGFLQKGEAMAVVTLADIAERTKISKFFLSAIENEDFGKLPGGIFDRSYIRQYAEAAGLDAEAILERYHLYHARRERRNEPPAPSGNGTGLSAIRTLFSWGT